MKGFIIFNGVNSRDHGIVIESYPQSCHAPRRGTLYEIAGRNGSGVKEDGTYGTYTQPYNINIREGLARRADLRSSDLAQWLTGEPGFLRLEDSFEPEYFRMARFAGPINIDQIMGRWGRAQIEFECQPERYLVSGEKAVDGLDYLPTNPFIMANPTGRTAHPIVRIGGAGDVTLTFRDSVGDRVIGIHLGTGKGVEIDCDACRCWELISTTVKTPADNLLFWPGQSDPTAEYHEFPTLRKGNTQIIPAVDTQNPDSRVVMLEVVPNWWTL